MRMEKRAWPVNMAACSVNYKNAEHYAVYSKLN